jgi:Glycosyl hydrolase family 26
VNGLLKLGQLLPSAYNPSEGYAPMNRIFFSGIAVGSLAGILFSGCEAPWQSQTTVHIKNPARTLYLSAAEPDSISLANSPASSIASVGKDPKAFGIYQWDKERSYGDGLDQEIAHLGTAPGYALYFVDKGMGFPTEVVKLNAKRNIRTIVTQELERYGQAWDPTQLDSILAGRWDAYFRKFAQKAKATKEVVYYRFGYEMNGDWVGWGERPDAFRLAWRRAWRIFREENATNVRWVFSPNVLWDGRTFAADILPYYPGDTFVDVVGLDGYNFGDRHSRHHRWRSFEEVFGASLAGMKTHFKGKPLWIAEIGCAEGEGKTAWINDFLARFNADPDLRVFIWFNEDKQYAGEPNWRLDSEPNSLATFRDWVLRAQSITTFALPLANEAGNEAGTEEAHHISEDVESRLEGI